MSNLENILGEKKTRIAEAENIARDALSQKEAEYKSRLIALDKEYEKDKDKINNSITKSLANIEGAYSQEITESLIKDLKEDYNLILAREKYGTLSEEKINQVKAIKKILSRTKKKEEKESLLNVLVPETRNLLDVSDIAEMGKQREITTYVSANGANCYILIPALDDSTALAKSLSDKLLGVIGLGKITLGNERSAGFKGEEVDYPQGFIMFKLETRDPKYLAKALVDKLNDNNIQPELFKEKNLVNKAKELDFEILNNFIKYSGHQEEEKKVKVGKKMGRPFGSKKANESKLPLTSNQIKEITKKANEVVNELFNESNYLKFKYDSLTEKYGYPLSRTEINKKARPFYDKIRKAEKEGVTIDFLPSLKEVSKGAIKDSNLEKSLGENALEIKESAKSERDNTDLSYNSMKSKYDSLTEKYGHPLSRTEIATKARPLYDKIKHAEEAGVQIDFIPRRQKK
jgi:hypothetical protein